MKNTSFPSYPGEKLAFVVVVVVGGWGGVVVCLETLNVRVLEKVGVDLSSLD